MTQYRKLPVVVEAQQFFYDAPSWPDGVYQTGDGKRIMTQVETLSGPVEVKDGWWIITGVEGERYPCKPEIFAETYELVTVEMDPSPAHPVDP